MSNLTFSVQTLHTMQGGTLKSVKPDKDGVYRRVPIAVIGLPSRNNALYEPTSFVNAITDSRTRFFKNLTEGNLEGEWGHPIIGTDKKDAVSRTLHIDRAKVSHYFTRVWTEPVDEGNYTLVFADVVPCGPFGPYLKESFEDVKRNTSFSLRSLTAEPRQLPNGVLSKSIVALVTFDAVDGPGFEAASKRFMSSEDLGLELVDEESISIPMSEVMQFPDFETAVGFEAVKCQEILDIFEAETVVIAAEKQIRGILDKETGTLQTQDGPKSVFHSLF